MNRFVATVGDATLKGTWQNQQCQAHLQTVIKVHQVPIPRRHRRHRHHTEVPPTAVCLLTDQDKTILRRRLMQDIHRPDQRHNLTPVRMDNSRLCRLAALLLPRNLSPGKVHVLA